MSAPVALGRQAIAPTIPEFLRKFPEIRLELDLSDRFVNLTQEGFDLTVRHTSTVPQSHVASVLCESQAVLIASEDYLRQRGVPQHPVDLAQHDCLLYLRDGGAPSWSFVRSVGRRRTERVSVPVSGPFKANNSEVLREAVMGGLGIGLVPDFSLSGRATPGSVGAVIRVLPDWKPVGFFGERLYALRPWAPRAPRAVQCVIDHLREVFAGGFPAAVRPSEVARPNEVARRSDVARRSE
jgi:DNA-binding transcriptional LysR family regulator